MEVDKEIRRMIDEMISKDIFSCINFIIVSDHGMADSPPKKLIVDLQNYVPELDKSALVFYGAVTSIRPKNDSEG